MYGPPDNAALRAMLDDALVSAPAEAPIAALIKAAEHVLASEGDPEGGLLHVHWRRAGALRAAVAAVKGTKP